MTDGANPTATAKLVRRLRYMGNHLSYARMYHEAADCIEALVADRDRCRDACAEWVDASQTNYQRAKAAEGKLSQARSALRTIEATSDQPGIVSLARDALEEWSKI